MTIELLPTRAVFPPGEPIGIEIRGGGSGELVVDHLGDEIARVTADSTLVVLDGLSEGGYGVELRSGQTRIARTAVDVRADVRTRLRYGFVADFRPDRDPAGLADTVRRLHLTAVQFYDWAYRHADLLGGGERYDDALGNPVSLDTVRRLTSAIHETGASALGYAAVYAVAPDQWDEWSDLGLVRTDGTPWGLGDFLFVVDPSAPRWLDHFRHDLRDATAALGFDGFHLDQYGLPHRATRGDGVDVDLTDAFPAMLRGVREALPGSRLVFNNVNDFPTAATARAPQDGLYIEPWEPMTTLGSLAALVERTRAVADGRPIAIAAYQHAYDLTDAASADRATSLTMAALASRGATQLLAGEADRVLVDPYYVRNHVAEASTRDLLARWYDFLVAHDELLFAPDIVDVTASYAGGYNDDCDVRYGDAVVSTEAAAGTVWRSITASRGRLVVHAINLVGQPDSVWDAPRAPFGEVGQGTVRVSRLFGRELPRIRVADPDAEGRLIDLEVIEDGAHAVAQLPALHAWQLILIDQGGRDE